MDICSKITRMNKGFSALKTGWAVVYVAHPCFGAENIHILRKDYHMDDKINKVRKPKRTRDIRVDLHISQEEYNLIQERMTEAGTANMSAFIRKMAMNGYVLHVDLPGLFPCNGGVQTNSIR